MKLFIWNSDWRTDWSSGCLVVLATNVKQARKTVFDDLLKDHLKEYHRDTFDDEYLTQMLSKEPDKVISNLSKSQIVVDEYGGS